MHLVHWENSIFTLPVLEQAVIESLGSALPEVTLQFVGGHEPAADDIADSATDKTFNRLVWAQSNQVVLAEQTASNIGA